MTMLNDGLNRIRTILADDITAGQVGSGSALPVASNTGLGDAITASSAVISSVTANSDKTVNVQFVVPSNTAVGSAINEFELKLSTNDSLIRKVHETIDKDNTKEVRYFTSVFVGQRK